MSILDNFAKKVLKIGKISEEVRKETALAIAREKKKWAEETTKIIKEVAVDKIEKKKYVVTSGGQNTTSTKRIEAKELPSNKVFRTLYRLYSDSPGSVQCVDRIRDSVLGGGYVLDRVKGERGSKQELKKLINFFDNPNQEGETIEDIVGGGIVNYLAYGNWYIEKVMNKRGNEIAEIYNLDPAKVSILVDDTLHKDGVDKKKGYVRMTTFNKKVVYDTTEICHIKRSSPSGDIYGQAVLETNSSTLLLLINALTYNTNLMKNGGVPPLQINLPDDSTENDAEAVSRFYEINFGGPWNAGKPLVTFKGAKAEKLGISPQDMRYMDLMEYGVRQVTGMFGVPLILIGIPDGTNRATASSSVKSFYLTKIYPLRKYIANKITQDIIVKGFGIKGWKLDFRTIGLEESDSTRRDVMTGYSKGLYSFNETRQKLGLLPLEEEWAKGLYLLGSKNDILVPVEDAIGMPPENPSAQTEDADPDGDKDVPKPKASGGQGTGADEGDE